MVQFQYFNWTENCCPKSAASLLEMMGHLDKAQQQADNNPIVVLCRSVICKIRSCFSLCNSVMALGGLQRFAQSTL